MIKRRHPKQKIVVAETVPVLMDYKAPCGRYAG